MNLSRRAECPGPCNPRNRTCRWNCIQSIAAIINELPPCIRMRLCEEDLLAVLAKAHSQGGSGAKNVATTCEDMPTKSGRPDGVSSAEAKYTQTAVQGTCSFRDIVRTQFMVVKGVILRVARMLHLMNGSPVSCCMINATMYLTIMFLLALFAWNNPTYQVFLSTQICGILIMLSWRISGTVLF